MGLSVVPSRTNFAVSLQRDVGHKRTQFGFIGAHLHFSALAEIPRSPGSEFRSTGGGFQVHGEIRVVGEVDASVNAIEDIAAVGSFHCDFGVGGKYFSAKNDSRGCGGFGRCFRDVPAKVFVSADVENQPIQGQFPDSADIQATAQQIGHIQIDGQGPGSSDQDAGVVPELDLVGYQGAGH